MNNRIYLRPHVLTDMCVGIGPTLWHHIKHSQLYLALDRIVLKLRWRKARYLSRT